MSFTGKATYSAGANLPEIAEDVSDLIGIISPAETPVLDALGDPMKEAKSSHHEWLEDELMPNKDSVDDSSISNPLSDIQFDVNSGSRFRVGDQIQLDGSSELMLVTAISDDTLTVIRAYGGTSSEAIINGDVINILGNAALEGADKPELRFTNRIRKGNYTQIFTAAVEVSGTDLACSQLGLDDEMDYQKQLRLRELVRDLENTVINGGKPIIDPQGSTTVRRTMSGIIQQLVSNVFYVGDQGFPSGSDLQEDKINYALRRIWEISSGSVNLIVVNGSQKRQINSFVNGLRSYSPGDDVYRDTISMYESDFGLCRVVTTRWMPQDAVLLLDSSRISVLPLAGRSFHYKPLGQNGDYESGQLIGEYTLELRNESAHGMIRGLSIV